MALLLIMILAILCILAMIAIYSYLQLRKKLILTTAELRNLHETEQQLQLKLAQKEQKLQQVLEDSVTGLPGWSVFEDRLKQSLKECERYHFSIGVLLVDIDDFKVINNALGYEVGDALLKEVSIRLRSCIRQVDSISRFTKDTLAILLSQLAKPETTALVVQRMLKVLAEPFQILGNELYITAGIGIALCPADGKDPASLMQCADEALHLAKEKGKHLYQFYQQDMHIKSQRDLVMNVSLNKEFINKEFIIYYQPTINVQNKQIICMDAMLFWQHPDLGLIKPQELSLVFEKQRKSNVMTEWLLENACKQFLKWQESGFQVDLLGIAISLKQLEHSQFIYRISQILQECKFNPTNLLIELTDGAPQLSFDVLEKAFNMLEYMGVKIAIEDFGISSFPLRYLKNLKINYIKLNHALVDDIVGNPQTLVLIKSILLFTENLAIQVIIQGVKSQDQVSILQGIGCFLMQGQYIGAAAPEGDLPNKMAVT